MFEELRMVWNIERLDLPIDEKSKQQISKDGNNEKQNWMTVGFPCHTKCNYIRSKQSGVQMRSDLGIPFVEMNGRDETIIEGLSRKVSGTVASKRLHDGSSWRHTLINGSILRYERDIYQRPYLRINRVEVSYVSQSNDVSFSVQRIKIVQYIASHKQGFDEVPNRRIPVSRTEI